MDSKKNILAQLWAIFLIVGPGLFCVGYTIGTGSVTSMIVAGSKYGTEYLWVVALSCLFSGVLMEAYGRFALATGETAIHAFRKRFGACFALLVMVMVIAGQWCCLSGLVGLSSNAFYEGVNLYFPDFVAQYGSNARICGLIIAIVLLVSLYLIFWFGSYSRIESVLVVLVTLLGLSFVVSLFLVPPRGEQIFTGLVPRIPKVPGASMLIAAMVGTTLAAPTFVVRPILVLSKGWSLNDLKKQRMDVFVSAAMMFLISGSIMCCAAGAIYNRGGEPIEKVLDMVETLRPIAGNFAALLFLIGLISAGISSILPIAMIAGYLQGDFRNGSMEVRTPVFRVLTAIACLMGLTVPILGANPVTAQVATQVAQVFVLPLIIGGITILVNRKSLMKERRAGIFLNLGLIASFGFSLVISWQALIGVIDLLK
ncbi:MAG: Nramp family divalent metal transporter [Planctomycetia bacterium]|nr:Nramp family divalent metal transporter [Planctomycetia bacterium]